jgi:hypothetical protein
MSWVSQFSFSLLLIIPGVAILFRNPRIAQLWFSNPGPVKWRMLGNSTWDELSIFKKVTVYLGGIAGLILGVILLYGTISDILSHLEI